MVNRRNAHNVISLILGVLAILFMILLSIISTIQETEGRIYDNNWNDAVTRSINFDANDCTAFHVPSGSVRRIKESTFERGGIMEKFVLEDGSVFYDTAFKNIICK